MKFTLLGMILLGVGQLLGQSILRPAYPGLVDVTAQLNCLLTNPDCNPREDQATQIVLSQGTWVINGTVFLKARDQIVLEHGAQVLRQASTRSVRREGPIFHLLGDFASVIGANRNEIKTEEGNMPEGMLKVGHTSAAAIGGIDYCQISNLNLEGPSNFDETNANNRNVVGIYFYNNQHEPQAPDNTHSYFHTVDNVVFERMNIGIKTYNTNACTFNQLLFNRIGIGGGFAFLLEGSEENKISNIHHHSSIHANSLGFIDSNRANPCQYNSVVNYVIEIGKRGTGYCLVLDVPETKFYNNTLSMTCNHDNVVNYKRLSRSLSLMQQRDQYFNKLRRNTMLDFTMYVLPKMER